MNLCFKIKLLPAVILFALALTLFAPVGLGAGPISLSKKSIPAITFKNLSPPYTDYGYFQYCRLVPFEYRASSFSLGAALSTLAADRLLNVQGLYTFGSPRVGDDEFQKRFEPKAFRVVNGKDIVADVPPKGPYRHVGEHMFIDQKGVIHAWYRSTKETDDASRDTDSNASGNVGEVRKSDSAFYILDSIRDHVPVLYSIYLWNKLVESLTGCEIPKMTQTAAATTEPAASEPEADASAGTPVDSDNPLSGTEWRLVEFQSMDDTIGTVKPEDPSFFTMRLNSDGTVNMRLDCNSASGTWISEPSEDGLSGRFEFGALAATRAMCPPPNLDEHILTQARYIRGYLLREGKLYLSLMADGGIYAWEPDTDKSSAASVPAAPEDGGVRNWAVTGVSRALNLREQPTITARIVASYAPGTILDNLGCQHAEGRIWCDVQQLGGGPRGYVAAEFLKPAVSPDGSVATGPDDSALRAGQGDFDATGQIPCAQYSGQPMTECEFGVARAGGGYATVVIKKPDGRTRAIFFRMGKPIGADNSEADGYPEFGATKENDLHLIRVGSERYEIPDAVVLGG